MEHTRAVWIPRVARAAGAGCALRPAHAAARARLQRRRDPDARHRHRPHHRRLQRRERRAGPAARLYPARRSSVLGRDLRRPARRSSSCASPEFAAWRDQAAGFERVAGFFVAGEPIDVGAEVVQARIAAGDRWLLGALRRRLRARPVRRRPGEEGLVLSHASSSAGFAATLAIVGRQVTRDGRADDRHRRAAPAISASSCRRRRRSPPSGRTTSISSAPSSSARPSRPPGSALQRARPREAGRVDRLALQEEIEAIRTRTAQSAGRWCFLPRLRIVP